MESNKSTVGCHMDKLFLRNLANFDKNVSNNCIMPKNDKTIFKIFKIFYSKFIFGQFAFLWSILTQKIMANNLFQHFCLI
jgi:hypothetical protein